MLCQCCHTQHSKDVLIITLKRDLTFLLFGLFVTNREADGDSSMEDIAVSITSMIQQSSKGLATLIQQEGLLKVHQILSTRFIVTAQHMLHQCLFLKDIKRLSEDYFLVPHCERTIWIFVLLLRFKGN